jgi:hypothetical protein
MCPNNALWFLFQTVCVCNKVMNGAFVPISKSICGLALTKRKIALRRLL